MPLHSPSARRRERICVFGPSGAGKTKAWMSIAEMARITKSDTKFYVMDTDLSAEAMLEGYPKLAEWDNLIIEEPFEYAEMMEAATTFRRKAKRGDWIICDMISTEWEAVQAHYSNEVYGTAKADYFLQKRREMEEAKKSKNFQPFEGWTDWPVIKSLHNEFINTVVLNNKAHVFATAKSKPLSRSGDATSVVEQFEHLGARPEGEKRMAHLFHTALLLKRKDEETWEVSTGKDREREQLWREPLNQGRQFVKAYLMDVAGWKLN